MNRIKCILLISTFVNCLIITVGKAQQDTLFYKQGKEQFDKKNYNNAAKYFSKAIEINKKYVEAYYNRALCLNEQKKNKKALEDCNIASYLKPKDSDTYNLIGKVYADMKNTGESILNYNKAISYDSLNADAWNNRGALFFKNEEYIKAENDYLTAIKYGQKDALGLYYTNLGAIYILINKNGRAIEVLTRAIELNWPDKYTYLYRAMAYDKIGKIKEADEDRKKAKEFKILKDNINTH